MATGNSTKGKVLINGSEALRCLLVMVALAVTTTSARSAEPIVDTKSENKLVGTWKLVSAKFNGQEAKFEEGFTTVKHVTTTQFMWASYDKDGKVTRAAGGDYTLKGELYEETPKYGISSDFDDIKGKVQTFKWKVEANRWYHNGKLSEGTTIEEVWERVEKK